MCSISLKGFDNHIGYLVWSILRWYWNEMFSPRIHIQNTQESTLLLFFFLSFLFFPLYLMPLAIKVTSKSVSGLFVQLLKSSVDTLTVNRFQCDTRVTGRSPIGRLDNRPGTLAVIERTLNAVSPKQIGRHAERLKCFSEACSWKNKMDSGTDRKKTTVNSTDEEKNVNWSKKEGN